MLNQKKINSFILLLILVVPVLISPNHYQVDGEIEEILESTDNLLIDPISNDIGSSVLGTKQSEIDYDKFYLSESVKTEIEFNKQPIDYTHTRYEVWPSIGEFSTGIRFVTYDIWNGLADDDNVIHFEMYSDVLNEPIATDEGFELETKIYCGGAGTLHYDFRGLWVSNTPSYPTYTYSIWKTDTFTVTSTMLDSLGYLNLLFRLEMSNSGNYVGARLYYFSDSGITQITAGVQTGVASVDFIGGSIKVDYLYFIRDTITNTVRSEQKYASSAIMINKKIIPSVPHAKEIRVNLMEDETVTSVNPSASWSVSSNVLTISSPVELNYEILTSRTCSNLLAIADFSNTYLTNIGFEDGINFLVEDYGTYPDSVEISTSIIHEGYYSLEIEDSGTKYLTFPDKLISGEYYLSLWFYIDEIGASTNEFLFYYKDTSDSWVNKLIFDEDTSKDRWHRFTLFFKTADSTDEEMFKLSFVDNVKFYIDNIKLFQTSTTIETLEPSKYLISSTLIAWDGYKNPSIPYADLEFELWDRPDQIIEESYSTTTNEYGVATWILERGLEHKEYGLGAYSLDSYFGSEQTKVDATNSVADWSLVNEDTGTETFTCVDSTLIFEFRETGTVNWEIQYAPSADFDISSSDIMYYTYRSNVTSHVNYKWFQTDSSNHIINQTNQEFTSNTVYHLIDFFRHSGWSETGTFDDTTINIIFLRAASPVGWIKVEIFDFRFINVQKLYFTPSVPSQTDYAETELNDAWDFSDGDKDAWDDGEDHAKAECDVTNGHFNFYKSSSAQSYFGKRWYDDGSTINMNDYDYFVIRWKSNSTVLSSYDVCIQLYLSSDYSDFWGHYILYKEDYQTRAKDTWHISIVPYLSKHADGDMSSVETMLIHLKTATESFVEDDTINIDYIKLVHIDSFLEETNDYATDVLLDAWDFEEGDTETLKWQTNNPASVTYVDGKLRCEATASTTSDFYIQFDPVLYPDITDYDLFVMKVRSSIAGSIRLFSHVIGGGWKTYATVSMYDDEVFRVETCALSYQSYAQTQGIRFRFVKTGGNYEIGDYIEIEYIKIIDLEEMPYTTIQNSVLIESETNDLQYNVYFDWNLIGVFNDLSLIPLPQTVGTHYVQVQPFRTDQAYITQNVYSYYYTIAADSFSVSVGSFYLSDSYVNTYVTSNYDYNYYIYEDNDPAGSGSGNKEGTAISSNRDTTEGVTIDYAIKFVYSSEIVWFNTSYSNSRSAFYVEEYKIDIQEENIQIIWSTTKSDIDSLTVYEGTVLKVDADTTSPSSWTKSTTVGVHYVTLIFEAVTYGSIIYSFNYEIVLEVFEINIESFHLSELYVSTYVTASENGNYQVYENNTVVGSEGTLQSIGTSIQTDRNTTADTFINYAIKFWNAESDVIWFNTTYSNVEGDFFVIEYSVNIAETTITVTWSTSLPDSDELTVKEDGANKVTDDTESPSDWAKSVVVGTHSVVLLFESDGYATITYSFNYHIYAVADFQVDIGSFQVSDDYVNTYASSNYDGNYYVYEDNIQIDTSILYGAGTVIETSRDTTAGVTIAYAIKFVYEAIEVWFNTTYSNPVTPFHLTDYRVTDGSTIVITWDSTLPALDSLTIYEDGNLKVNADPSSTTSWTKSTEVGNHYVTLIFSATDYTDIIHSFSYIVYPPTAFSIDIDTFYVTDDYVNMYLTANFDYTYTAYENNTEIGTGNGLAVGTTIISPKNKEAGLYNFTIIFTYNSETIPFMTWYSNLIPPNHPFNDLWRMESQGFYNISIYSNLDSYWIDIYHDHVLIIDDSTATFFSIEKGLRVGWHNITLVYTYNCSTNAEGYPVNEYNITLSYEFNYETTFFYNIMFRYIEDTIGLAISEINVNDFTTYIDGELVLHGDFDDVEIYSNYSYISNYDIRIKNTAALHSLVVKDLLDTTILSTTLDISSFTYKIIKLPIYRLGVINWDNETHRFGVQTLANIDKPWHLSPEIPQGVFIEFWFCDVIYLFRIYSATTYYDEDGYPYKLWDQWEDLPPGRLPMVFEIPLSYDGEEDDDPEPGWWTNPAFIGGMSLAGFIIILIALIVIYRLIKKKGVFKK